MKDYKELKQEVEQVLQTCKDNNIRTIKGNKTLYNSFVKCANVQLKTKSLKDVKEYESLIFSFVSQFDDLYKMVSETILMDVASLYIALEETNKGDTYFQYVLRDTDHVEDVYYRWANAYIENDYSKARVISKKALKKLNKNSVYYDKFLSILQ